MHQVVKTPVLGKEAKDITHEDLKKIDLHGIIGRSVDTYMDDYKDSQYENPLVGVAVTTNIASEALNAIISFATLYMDIKPILKFLDKASHEEWRQWGPGSASTCPVRAFTSPFIGKTTKEMVQIIQANHEGTCINGRWFYIVDQQTAYDSTLLLVEIPLMYPENPRTVRVFPALANCEAEILVRNQGGFRYLLDSVNTRAVYHGYEYVLDHDFRERVNATVQPLLDNRDCPVSYINVIDPVPQERPSSKGGDTQLASGMVDVYRGFVDNTEELRRAYPPSECDTIIEDFLDEFGDNSPSVSDESYVEDLAHDAEAIASQFTLDERYFDEDRVGAANDDAYYLSDDGNADDTDFSGRRI